MTIKTKLLALITLLLFVACEKSVETTQTTQKPVVSTVNYPLYYFADRLAGDLCEVRFDAPSDIDPAFWQPTAEHIASFQQSDLILLNGASYAKWLSKSSLPEDRLVDTSLSFQDKLIETHDSNPHAHGDGDVHSHAGTAFTTWLDFEQAAQHVQSISTNLIKLLPDSAETISKRTEELVAELNALNQELAEITSKIEDPLLASHPVYHYLARAYDLKILSLIWEPEMTLTPDHLEELQLQREMVSTARHFIWEGEPLPALTTTLSEKGLTSLVFSPCSNRPEEGDFMTVMRANLDALRAITQ